MPLRMATGYITSSILELGKGVFSPISRHTSSVPRAEPGAAPGIEQYLQKEDTSLRVGITVIDYGEHGHATNTVEDISAALASAKPEKPHVRWINIDGFRPSVVDTVCKHFGIHTERLRSRLLPGSQRARAHCSPSRTQWHPHIKICNRHGLPTQLIDPNNLSWFGKVGQAAR